MLFSSDNAGDSRIDCNSMVMNGLLSMTISYNTKYYKPETAETFAQYYYDVLKKLIDQYETLENTQWLVPSDIPMANLTQNQINALVPVGVTDVYPLSPLQKGILFHTLKDPHSGGYIIRSAFVIEGKLNLDYLKNAWTQLVKEYEILRTNLLVGIR